MEEGRDVIVVCFYFYWYVVFNVSEMLVFLIYKEVWFIIFNLMVWEVFVMLRIILMEFRYR